MLDLEENQIIKNNDNCPLVIKKDSCKSNRFGFILTKEFLANKCPYWCLNKSTELFDKGCEIFNKVVEKVIVELEDYYGHKKFTNLGSMVLIQKPIESQKSDDFYTFFGTLAFNTMDIKRPERNVTVNFNNIEPNNELFKKSKCCKVTLHKFDKKTDKNHLNLHTNIHTNIMVVLFLKMLKWILIVKFQMISEIRKMILCIFLKNLSNHNETNIFKKITKF